MKSTCSLFSLFALFLVANTASAAVKRNKVKGKMIDEHRILKMNKGDKKHEHKNAKNHDHAGDAAFNAAITNTTADDPVLTGAGKGDDAAGEFSEIKGTDTDMDFNQLNGEGHTTSSGNKFFIQERSVAVCVILAAGLGFL
mmetsp:Transcript_15199/g.21185  ORF Transcript_15199/g.21185 Transcript_15199/m.21185 type:complete len:141 (+) Transcript_15199:48-470(+)